MKTLYIIGGIFLFLFLLSYKTKKDEEHLRNNGLMPGQGQQGTMEQVQMLMEKGHKIEAIKVYRSIHRVGLKEAKDAVEKLAEEKKL